MEISHAFFAPTSDCPVTAAAGLRVARIPARTPTCGALTACLGLSGLSLLLAPGCRA